MYAMVVVKRVLVFHCRVVDPCWYCWHDSVVVRLAFGVVILVLGSWFLAEWLMLLVLVLVLVLLLIFFVIVLAFTRVFSTPEYSIFLYTIGLFIGLPHSLTI